jgi:hypothetical protein
VYLFAKRERNPSEPRLGYRTCFWASLADSSFSVRTVLSKLFLVSSAADCLTIVVRSNCHTIQNGLECPFVYFELREYMLMFAPRMMRPG